MRDRARGVVEAGAGMALLSTDSLFVRLADTDTADVVFWTGSLTAAVMLSVASVRSGSGPVTAIRRGGRAGLLVGVLQAVTVVAFVAAVGGTSIPDVMAIVAATPLVGALLARVLIGEATSRRTWLAIAASAAGAAVILAGSLGTGGLGGNRWAVVAITAFGSAAVVLRRAPDLSRPLVVGLGGLLAALAAAWPASLSGHGAVTWFALVAMGAITGPLARLLISSAPRHLPVAEVALFAPLESVLAVVWALVLFGEDPAATTAVGGALVVAAVLWGVWPDATGTRRIRTSA